MPEYPIDLGRSYNGMDFTLDGPKSSEPEKHYPDVRFEWSEPYELPASGKITFEYRTTEEETKTYPDGKQKFCLDIELLEIVDAKGSKVERDERAEASSNLDKLRDESGDYE